MLRSNPAPWDQLIRRFSGWCAIERMTADRAAALCTFFKRAYADQPTAWAFQDDARIIRRWRWLNEGNPIGFDGGIPAWIGLRKDQIVGHFGVLPVEAVTRGHAVPLWWGRDLIVAPEARQFGIGPLLVMKALETVPPPIFVAGLNEASASLFQQLGFLDGGRIPVYVKVFRPARLLEAFQRPWLPQRILSVSIRLVQRLMEHRDRSAQSIRVVPLETFEESFDSWWKSIESKFACIVRRTSASMTWRYRAHPDHLYHVAAAMDGESLRGVVVVRHGRSRGLPVGFISELLADPADRPALDALLAYAEAHLLLAAAEPIVFLRCTVLHRVFERALMRAGFVRAPSPVRWMLAHADGSSEVEPLLRRDDWFLSAGDSDLDML